MPTIEQVQVRPEGLEVVFAGRAEPESYSWFWLQDHSQDDSRFNAETRQRTVDTFALDPSVTGVGAEVRDGAVHVSWSDGSPDGFYPEALLAGVAGLVPDRVGITLWPTPPVEPQRADYGAVVSSDAALRDWLDHLHEIGYAVVQDMPATPEAAEVLARRIGYPRDSVFGAMWRLSSEMTDHSDTAYTQTFLEPHTDSTYCIDAPGTQLFCCMERDGTGGESVLVDGFAIADEIRRDDPEAFRILTTTIVDGHYLEPGVHLAAARPTISLDPRTGEITQVTFNNYDRAPFRLPADQEAGFYRAYGEFHRRLNDRSRWLSIRLNAGDALIFDNWRTFHGRMEYRGRRVFVGCYHNREDVDGRRRVLEAAGV